MVAINPYDRTVTGLYHDASQNWFQQKPPYAGPGGMNNFPQLLQKLSDTPIPLDTGDFRLMSRRVVNQILQMPERHRFIRGMVSWVGYRQVPFFYDREKRFAGETKYPFFRLLALALDGIAASSTKPLMLASYAGALFAFLCLGFIGYAIYSLLFVGQTPQG